MMGNTYECKEVEEIIKYITRYCNLTSEAIDDLNFIDSLINRLVYIIDDYKSKYEQLENIRKEAIEYIDRRDIEWGSDEHDLLLSILNKGSEES